MGPWTQRFEARFTTHLGTPHAVCVSSGTAGLLLALQRHGVGPGDEVVIPSLTFVADANVVRALGAEPVFADIESSTGRSWPADDILAAVGPRTRVPSSRCTTPATWPTSPLLRPAAAAASPSSRTPPMR